MLMGRRYILWFLGKKLTTNSSRWIRLVLEPEFPADFFCFCENLMFLLLQTYRRNSKTAQRCSKTNLKNQSMCGFCCFFWWPCYIWRHKICQCCLLLFVQGKLPLPSERSQGLSREAEKKLNYPTDWNVFFFHGAKKPHLLRNKKLFPFGSNKHLPRTQLSL